MKLIENIPVSKEAFTMFVPVRFDGSDPLYKINYHRPLHSNGISVLPDYAKWYFRQGSNYESTGKHYTVIDQNNVGTPVRRLDNIVQPSLMSQLEIYANGNKLGAGIYVVEEYYVDPGKLRGTTEFHMFFKTIIDRMLSISNSDYRFLALSEFYEWTKDIEYYIVESRQHLFRFITYIPSPEIDANKLLYVNGPNILVTIMNPTVDMVHPRSNLFMDAVHYRDPKEQLTQIDIRIVDNDRADFYYVNLCGKVQAIRPVKQIGGLNQTTVVMSNSDNGAPSIRVIAPEEYEANGIYRTKAECEAHGDLKSAIEHKKLDFELRHLEHKENMLGLSTVKELINIKLAVFKTKFDNLKIMAEREKRQFAILESLISLRDRAAEREHATALAELNFQISRFKYENERNKQSQGMLNMFMDLVSYIR